ncbi:hypothetical protein LMG10661_01881 [Ralstonia syzygii subsp. syzygii]|nr:hypothetical protein LMG10661_01881 [Ralstonia syzygii subsp. syzygii]
MIAVEGLRQLHKSMRALDLDRYRFRYRHGRAEFDVFFFADGSPYKLLFGARGHAFAFEFDVQSGYRVIPQLSKDDYKTLCRVLGLTYDPNNPFSVKGFLSDFSSHVPGEATIAGRVSPNDLGPYRPHVDEADKVYFIGWLNHHGQKTDVSEANLAKTRELLGVRAYQTCKTRRISSRWTNDAGKATDYYPPD